MSRNDQSPENLSCWILNPVAAVLAEVEGPPPPPPPDDVNLSRFCGQYCKSTALLIDDKNEVWSVGSELSNWGR